MARHEFDYPIDLYQKEPDPCNAISFANPRPAGIAMTNLVVLFLFCCALIAFAGSELCRSGEAIAHKSGLTRSWIGLALTASITSLPELVTGISSVTVAGAPNLAVADVFGSCVTNPALLAFVFLRPNGIDDLKPDGHILTGIFGVLMIAVAGIGVLLAERGHPLGILHVGVYSLLLLVLYAAAMRTLFFFERRYWSKVVEGRDVAAIGSLRAVLARYAVAGLAVAASATLLPFLALELVQKLGGHETFVGSLFMAAATSAPEMVITIAALRINATDIAVGNLLGSNLFDMVVLAVDDMAYPAGPILSHAAPFHMLSAFAAVCMTGLALVAMIYYRKPQQSFVTRLIGVLLIAIYAINSVGLYLYAR